jgi:HlyD family secretion protein
MPTNRRFPWIKLVMLAVVLAASGGGVWYWKRSHEAAIEYQSAPVARGDLTQIVTATGQLDPVVNVQVGSQISGRIEKLYADFNSVVKSNQVIADIEPSTYKVAVLRAEADVANAKANLALSQVQAERANTLFSNRLISASDHDIAIATLQQAKAQLQSFDAALASAKVDLSRCTIFAPVDGVVIARNVDVGQTVAASFNTPTLFQLAGDLTKMQIDALVSEADIGGVSVGQHVDFTVDAYPLGAFVGKVSQVRYGSITNQNVINYDCVIAVGNPDGKLLPGMTANVSIVIAERTNVLKIPNGALRFRPPEAAGKTNPAPQMAAQAARPGLALARQSGGPGAAAPGGLGGGRSLPERQVERTVYVLPDKAQSNGKEALTLKPVQIKVGITDGIMTEVTEGLEEGMQVVSAILTTDASATRPAPNPFGGGRRF